MLEQEIFRKKSAAITADLGGKGLFSPHLLYALAFERDLWQRAEMISMHIYLINDEPASLSFPVPFSAGSYKTALSPRNR